MPAEDGAFAGAAPYIPEDKAGLLAAVSGAATAQSLAYLQVLYEACWAFRRMQLVLGFANPWWNQKMQNHVENLKNEEMWFFSQIMVSIFQGIPSVVRGMEDKFEKRLGEFLSFLQSGSGPFSLQDIETISDYCGRLLWLCQGIPSRWDEIAMKKDDRVVGRLPDWLNSFNFHGTLMERDVQEQRKVYPTQVQSALKGLDHAVTEVYRRIRIYYSQQPRDDLAPPFCVLLSTWVPMIHRIGISPAANKSEAWDEFKRYLTHCNAYIKTMKDSLDDIDKRCSAAAGFFASAAQAIVNQDGVKELLDFQTVWLAYGRMLWNIANTFRISPVARTRIELILDLEDAKDYWFEVKRYIKSFPNLKPIERDVEVSQLP